MVGKPSSQIDRDAMITPFVLSEQSFACLPEQRDSMIDELRNVETHRAFLPKLKDSTIDDLRNVETHRDGTSDKSLSPPSNQRTLANSNSPSEL